MTALERLPEIRMEMLIPNSTCLETYCASCAEHGACRAWVLSAAQDAQCDAEWLAARVLTGTVDADTSVDEIKELHRGAPA